MKSNFLVILVMSIAPLGDLYGQSYNSILGQDTTTWKQYLCQLDQSNLIEKMVVDDTLMNGYTYFKVGEKVNNSIVYDMDGNFGIANGLVREDTSSGKVWFWAATNVNFTLDTLEYLVADMSLSLGDTFVVFGPYMDSTTTVDSVYYYMGNKHVRLDYIPDGVGPDGDKVTFIEGVGPNYGLAYMHYSNASNLCPCLLTYQKDGLEVYSNNSCTISSILKIDESFFNVKIYPHPIGERSMLKFDNPKSEDAKLILYDVSGRILSTYSTNNSFFELENSGSYKGLYFYQLELNDRKKTVGKLMFVE